MGFERMGVSMVIVGAVSFASSSCAVDAGEDVESVAAAATDPNDPRWDCYAPEPGHPTASEKRAFLTTNGAHAREAEQTYGVPAAAILAMAAVEGGYGFTRTAQYAKNSFGYKFVNATAAGTP